MIIATSSPNTWKLGAEAIKFYQKTKFSHVLIIKGDLVYQASHGYVNCVHIDVFLESNKLVDQFEIADEKVNMDFVYRQLGKKYSKLQLLEIAIKYLTGIKILINNGNQQFICSEFVGKALSLPWVTDFTSPSEIAIYLQQNK